MLEISNCYKLLHLDQDCSDLELRRRYRRCALETHPDRIRPLEVETQASCEQPFIKFNEAYRRIVHYRKQLRAAGRTIPRRHHNQNLHEGEDSFESLRERLGTLNCDMQESLSGKHPSTSGFASEINRIYEQHMNILESLSQRLRQMRQN